MFKKILLIFVIISFLVLIGSGESEEHHEFTELHNYSPAYTLIPMPNEIIVNKGDTANIDLYISGLGTIKENKILLRIPPKLLDSENPGKIVGSIKCRGNNRTNFESKVEIHDGDITSMRIVLNECNFMAVSEEKGEITTLKRAPILLSERDNINYSSMSLSGMNNIGYPPISIKMNIAKKAPHGDHNIYLVFTYTDGTKWYQDKEKIKIHINSFYEQYQTPVLILIAIIAALVVKFIGGSYTIIKKRRDDNVKNNKKPYN